ncbi:MAG: hypothetical protein IH865_10165 [Chloroflexi bacterium]|nr:hypothetical protein [Chloroflexota bacterium]
MRRLFLVLAIAVVGLVSLSALPRSGEAGNIPTWPDLAPGCFDVTGDGYVDLANDIFGVIMKYQTQPGDADYSLLYDVSGGGVVDLTNDILGTIQAYDTYCDLIDTQVILATVATMKYQDPAVAFADGYTWGSQDVPQMGIHLYNMDYLNTYTTFYDDSPMNLAMHPEQQEHQLTHPYGLVYSNAGGNQPGQLIGVWYVVPTQDVCDFQAVPGPCQDPNVMPVGFGLTNTDEDNPDPAPFQSSWHTHTGLCVRDFGTVNAAVTGENTSESNCLSHSDQWFSLYGWMMHLYNFVPNPDGRFMKWNTNPDFP